MNLAGFKKAFAGWLDYRELGDINKIWREENLDSYEYVSSFAVAVLYIEEGDIFAVFNYYRDDSAQLEEEFCKLLEKYGVWWEAATLRTLYLYDPEHPAVNPPVSDG